MYGQYGQTPNAAETAQMTQVMKRLGNVAMTKELQDQVAAEMKEKGASFSEIAKYRKNSPVGEDINAFYDTFTETMKDEDATFMDKAGAALRNVVNYGISSLTYGLIDPAKIMSGMSDDYISALQDTGTYSYGSSDDIDISTQEGFDELAALSGTERGAEPILRGVEDINGELVKGANRYKNTIDGVEKIGLFGGLFDGLFDGDPVESFPLDDGNDSVQICEPGFYFDPKEGICMPIASAVAGGGTGNGNGNGTVTDGGGSSDDIEIRERKDVTPRNKTTGDTRSLTFRTPKQFAQGGSVTPNIDSFFSNLR